MEVVALQVFVSLALVLGSLLLFAVSAKQRDYEHADRLALLPIEEDDPLSPRPCASAPSTPRDRHDEASR